VRRNTARRVTTRHLAVAAVASGLVVFAASPSIAGADRVRSEGELIRYGTSTDVPDAARARVQAVYNAAGDTIVTLHVWGLAPNHEYGAHAHKLACGATDPNTAGGHFQNVEAPQGQASIPQFANPGNEIWLDLTTDEDGNGVAQTKVPWQFSPARRPGSVMIHSEHTHDGSIAGLPAGSAGSKLACLTVAF
jgi:Cu-Zn family superoxide dismutase